MHLWQNHPSLYWTHWALSIYFGLMLMVCGEYDKNWQKVPLWAVANGRVIACAGSQKKTIRKGETSHYFLWLFATRLQGVTLSSRFLPCWWSDWKMTPLLYIYCRFTVQKNVATNLLLKMSHIWNRFSKQIFDDRQKVPSVRRFP